MPQSFRDLKIWQEALELMLMLYDMTSQFPKEELYNLTSQIHRASISVMANIAEGHDRPTHQERIRFFVMSSAKEYPQCQALGPDIIYLFFLGLLLDVALYLLFGKSLAH